MAYFFKLPPITELTIGQQAALNEPNAIAISGGPGTGKSVVSLWRHIRNYATGSRRSLLLTYTKSLEFYLCNSTVSEANIAETESEKRKIEFASQNVNRTLWWLSHEQTVYEEIIVDEAQDVDSEKYNQLKTYSDVISFGADDSQIVFPRNSTTENQLREIFIQNKSYFLDENFRNSYQILHFLKGFFDKRLIYQYMLEDLKVKERFGPKPILISSINNLEKRNTIISEIIELFIADTKSLNNTHNLAILVPLKCHVDDIYRALIILKINCTRYYEGLTFDGISNVHITTFKSAKGLEFDTVIIPSFEHYLWNIEKLTIAPITENDYYVAITRTKRNLYLLSNGVPSFLQQTEQQKLTYDIEGS